MIKILYFKNDLQRKIKTYLHLFMPVKKREKHMIW